MPMPQNHHTLVCQSDICVGQEMMSQDGIACNLIDPGRMVLGLVVG